MRKDDSERSAPTDYISECDSQNVTSNTNYTNSDGGLPPPPSSDRTSSSERSSHHSSSRWWQRVVSIPSTIGKSKNLRGYTEAEDDPDMRVRSVLESYYSSLVHNPRSSTTNHLSDTPGRTPLYTGSDQDTGNPYTRGLDEAHTSLGSAFRFMNKFGLRSRRTSTDDADESDRTCPTARFEILEGEAEVGRQPSESSNDEERTRRRLQSRITLQAMRSRSLERYKQIARTRRKIIAFSISSVFLLAGLLAAAVWTASMGVHFQKSGEAQIIVADNDSDSAAGSASMESVPDFSQSTLEEPMELLSDSGSGSSSVQLPSIGKGNRPGVLDSDYVGPTILEGSDESMASVEAGSDLASFTGSADSSGSDMTTPDKAESVTSASQSRSASFAGLGSQGGSVGDTSDFDPSGSLDPIIHVAGEDGEDYSTFSQIVYTYTHCLLMGISLWLSLIVILLHVCFRSFRTYSLPFVLDLSCVQCGYWVTALVRVQFVSQDVDNLAYLFFCMSECFFNFGQISFTCAFAFNLYRSVVSYADVLMDSHSAKRRYRSYSLNVMMLSLIASITLSLVGYRSNDAVDESDSDSFQPCLYPTCRLILYVYYPLLAFGFNFVFYLRFKRSIGEAYPMSATGRLNKVAQSYLFLFVVCWGSLILLTVLQTPPNGLAPSEVYFTLQCIFDVLGVGTAVITLTNFIRCRRAFDFGLSLKAIDPNSIEFEDPVQILGEGTFAVVLKALWHRGGVDNTHTPRTVEVAVKTFKNTQFECLDRMKEEAYLSSKLIHRYVMTTYGCYTSGSNLYIVSEYLGGGTLQDLLDASSSLSYGRVLRYAHMIALGMRFLHNLAVPIIHRDLKPLNCIFDKERENLKLADFGESRLFQTDSAAYRRAGFFPGENSTLQMTTNIGSACWAAPEVLKEEETMSEYSVKVDVYSFGIICWQLLTCKVPYVDIPGSVLAVAEAVIAGRRPEIPVDCPGLFGKIMTRCWHEDPLHRPTFDEIVPLLEMELAEELRKLQQQEQSSGRRVRIADMENESEHKDN